MNRFEFNTGDHKEEEEKVLVGRSYGKEVLYRFRKNKGAWISFFIIILLIVIALAAPAVSSYSYKEVHSEYSNLPPRIPGLEKLGIFDGVSHGQNMYEAKNCTDKYFFFGTDNLGRDIWTRVWEGTRISLLIAALAVIIDVCIGVIYGLVSGYFGGKVDMVMQRITEILSSLPTLVVVTLMLVVMKPGLGIIITFMFSIPNAIFLEAFLAFVGLGVPAPMASLGSLINDGYKSAMTYPHMVAAPVIVLGILMLGFNLFADGLRDAIDPQLKQM